MTPLDNAKAIAKRMDDAQLTLSDKIQLGILNALIASVDNTDPDKERAPVVAL